MRTMAIESKSESENSQTTGESGDPMALTQAELDERARKRLEVGLSAHRPTAKAAVLRPPDLQTLPVSPRVLAAALVGVLVVTLLLVVANLNGLLPTWWPTLPGITPTEPTPVLLDVPSQVYALRLAEDFSKADSPLLQGSRANEWRAELLPTESAFRIEAWPNHLAWSLVGLGSVQTYRLQTSVAVDAQTPDGFAGLIVRFQDDRHFYLFAVDGNGRYRIQQQVGDSRESVQPWSSAPFLNRAGSSNVLTVQEHGTLLQFFGNGMLLAEVSTQAEPGGYIGIAAGAEGEDVAEVRFDWFQLYERMATQP
jgi:hypothetical protein